MKPRIELGLPNNEYHAMPEFSSTQIKDVLRTPAHFYAKHLAGDRGHKDPTPNMLLGTVVHSLLLEPDNFNNEYAISQKFDRRTKQGKADAAEFDKENAHKMVIDAELYSEAKAITAQLEKHSVSTLLRLPDMIAEASIFYDDAETGLNCRIRPDFHLPPCDAFPNGLIVDLKTTDNASYTRFNRTIVNFGYHISAAMYCDGFMRLYETEQAPAYIWLVGERDAPYAVIAYSPNFETMQKGDDKKREALQLIADCIAANEWPAYSTDVLDINLPAWA